VTEFVSETPYIVSPCNNFAVYPERKDFLISILACLLKIYPSVVFLLVKWCKNIFGQEQQLQSQHLQHLQQEQQSQQQQEQEQKSQQSSSGKILDSSKKAIFFPF
jgi:hypothetical protein